MAYKFLYEDKELNFSTSSIDDSNNGSAFTTYSSSKIHNLLAQKQDKLAFDTTPTVNSNNPVTSAGIKSYVDTVASPIFSRLTTHVIDKNNPHAVTKSQVGLGNVEDIAINEWTGSSALSKCNKGDFGTVVTKNVSNAKTVTSAEQTSTVPSYKALADNISDVNNKIDTSLEEYSGVKFDDTVVGSLNLVLDGTTLIITTTDK